MTSIMDGKTPDSLVEERVAQLQVISQRRNALLRQMFHMVQRRQNVGSIIKLEDEEGDDELAAFLDKFDLAKNPETGTIHNLSENELISAASPEPSTSPPRHSLAPSSPRPSSEPPAFEEEPLTDTLPQSQDASSPDRPVSEQTRSTPASPIPTQLQPSPPPESDDELDLIGTPAVSVKSVPTQSRGPSEGIQVAATPASEPIIDPAPPETIVVVDADDSVDAEQIVIVNGDTTDEEDLVQIAQPPAEGADSQVPIVPEAEHEASSSLNEPPVHVQDVAAEEAATEPDVALPEVDEPPAEANDMVDEEDLFSVHDELTPPPTTEPDPPADSPRPSALHGVEQEVDVEAPEDVVMDDATATRLEELKDPPSQSPPENALSDNESMVIDEDDDERPAASSSTTLGVRSSMKESTPQPVIPTVPPPPVLLREPVSTLSPLPSFDFSVPSESPIQVAPETPPTPPQSRHGYQPIKLQRKHKEREKNSAGDKGKDKDDWTPLGISRWGATIRANPVHNKVSRAPKCLNSREWSVAMTELRLIRALEHVETLKDAGRWSFRQPKKQRGIGGLTKSHWDYVMDEMKWMRIDFREERRWKLALAYNLSTAVLEWHCFSTLAERVAKGICVGWRRPRGDAMQKELVMDEDILPLEQPMDAEMENISVPATTSAPSTSLLAVDYGSDDEDEDEQEKQSVVDALEPSSMLDDALDVAEKGPDAAVTDSGFGDVDFKRGDGSEEPPSASDSASKMDVDEADGEKTGHPGDTAEEEEKPSGLKDTSADPILSQADSFVSEMAVSATPATKSGKANIYAPLREYLAYSDAEKLFLDLNDFDRVVMNASADELSADPVFPPTDLSEIFPDLPPLGMLDTKKSEKRVDRDDPNKRAEEAMYPKLFPIGKFMHTKPTLIGPLQPAKRWKNGRWLNADDCPASDPDTPPLKVQDSFSDLFNPKFGNSSKSVEQPLRDKEKEKEAKDTPRRVVHMWTIPDDNLLKTFSEKYPNNWALIAECYNSARLTISTDKRSPRDCQERWKERWAPETTAKLPESTPAEDPPPTPTASLPPTPTPSMTTRGIKRLASVSVSGPPPVASGSDAKKRRRHQFVQETMRKASKKRAEQAQKMLASQRKPPAVHETHAQYSRLPKYSPAELSRMKAEKDYKDQQDLIAARRKHEEMSRAAQQQRLAPGAQAQAKQRRLRLRRRLSHRNTTGASTSHGASESPAVAARAAGQVNISQQQQQAQQQQQRIASPMAGASRMPMNPQQAQTQLLQQQARLHQQSQQAQQAQQVQHALLSQQQALAHQAAAGSSGTSSPRPTVPGNAVPRAQQPYMMSVQNMQSLQSLGSMNGFTTEQLQAMLLHMQHQQQAQQQQQQQGHQGPWGLNAVIETNTWCS
ncbi:hypothetical protein C8R46DRAFT_1063570 [Mycena filopes]|nr:hypothetical protein C8R46DRAFT_1063570 [Mycena filopes]